MSVPADLDRALVERYGSRPDRLAEVRACAEAWERLKAFGFPTDSPGSAQTLRGQTRGGQIRGQHR